MISKYLDFLEELEEIINYEGNLEIGQTKAYLLEKYKDRAKKLRGDVKGGQRGHLGQLMIQGYTNDNSKEPDIEEKDTELKTCVFECNEDNLTVKEWVKIIGLADYVNAGHVPTNLLNFPHALKKMKCAGYNCWLVHPDDATVSFYLGIVTHYASDQLLDIWAQEYSLIAEYVNEKIHDGIRQGIYPMELMSWTECRKTKFKGANTYLGLKQYGKGTNNPKKYGLYFRSHFVRSVLLPNSYIKKNESFAKFLVEYCRYHDFDV